MTVPTNNEEARTKFREPWFLSNDNGFEEWVITDGVETFSIADASQTEFGLAVQGTIERALAARRPPVSGDNVDEARIKAEWRWPIPINYREGDVEHTLLIAQRQAYLLGRLDADPHPREVGVTDDDRDRNLANIIRSVMRQSDLPEHQLEKLQAVVLLLTPKASAAMSAVVKTAADVDRIAHREGITFTEVLTRTALGGGEQ